MDLSGRIHTQIVSEALREWLSDEGRAAEYLPLQQVFALCFAGFLPRKSHGISAAADPRGHRPPQQLPPSSLRAQNGLSLYPSLSMGSALVRLLDSCLTAAAAAPSPELRRRAAANVLAAFCRSALREARLRGDSSSDVPDTAVETSTETARGWMHGGGGGGPPHREAGGKTGTGGATSATAAALDVSFLDAAFAVLSAVALRQPALVSELHVMELAWGAAPQSVAEAEAEVRQPRETADAVPAVATAAGQAAGLGAAGGGGAAAAAAAAASSHCVEGADAEGLADFFLSSEFQCRLAAGQLLYGMPYEEELDGTGHGGGSWGQRGAARQCRGRPGHDYGDEVVCGGLHGSRGDPYRQRGVGANVHGDGDGTRGGGGSGTAADAGELWERREEAEEAEVLAGLVEVPALAELCGAAAMVDLWPDLVGRVAEGGAEEAARWLGSLAEEAEEEEEAGQVGSDTWTAAAYGRRAAALLHGDGGGGADVGVNVGFGTGFERMGAEAGVGEEVTGAGVQRAMSRRCQELLAAALSLRPEVLLAALPPQLLCVLALRSGAVRRALVSGLAAAALSPAAAAAPGSASASEPRGHGSCHAAGNAGGSKAEPCVSGAAARHLVGRLAEWFRVVGLDLAEVMQWNLL
ncbi:hypothetical protein PLESTB_001767100 [Pleodorina starrii]|uniref:Uncharacterized protein n=1 Tax=Pleodorina starrii TaxID=330485 RepID=A0A9W6C131_9CHLO|nr:hypothetical protein PLESTM_001862300 [Pleodorina starrii]GLC61535.1 hypothetical protein PLESTB_001767100 [Pleodorina starrii]GLC76815.1 hypothetical protein PLESTF_001844100 [Pleodorina starrii]